jgi:polyisoprenoid-binding protein YceI
MAYGTSSSARQGGYTFVAGTGQVYVYVRHALTQNNSGSFKTVQAELIMGGTATVSGYQVALS